jgi:hypothetical protein
MEGLSRYLAEQKCASISQIVGGLMLNGEGPAPAEAYP